MDCSPPAVHQAPLSMGFSRQEYWSGLLFPPPGDLPDPGMEPSSLHLLHWQEGSLPLAPPGSDDEHLFIFLLVIYIPSSMKCLVIFAHFLFYFLTIFTVHLFIYFLPGCSLSFHPNRGFHRANSFNFDEVRLISFFPLKDCAF